MSAAPSCHVDAPTAVVASGDVRVALVGRPNSGKSSLYNRLTGGNARVGNYPGITVDVLEGEVTLPSGAKAIIADLPGLYSIEATVSADTDEGVARGFLDAFGKDERVVVVQVIDPTRLALGLRLTAELVRRKIPMVVALTHADVMRAEGRTVDVARLSEAVGVPVVLLSARDAAAPSALFAAIDDRLRSEAAEPVAFDAAKLARDVLSLSSDEVATKRRALTERLDAVLLHPVVGPFLFLGTMALVFAAVFLVADPVTTLFDALLARAKDGLEGAFGKGLVSSFLSDGLLGGAGTVLAFMPQIVILTIALELLEASGYLARGAFLVDRVLRLLGLSGRSFLPLLMGNACAIPAISATRVVRDPKERLTTILVIPLMTCSARLPTYGLVLAAFFSSKSPLYRAGIFVGLYFASILATGLASFVIRRTATKGQGLPLVLELPSSRVPPASVIARKAWQAARRFLRDVGTNILAVSAVLWVLLTVPMPGSQSAPGEPEIDASIAGSIGRTIEPLTRPAGFDWKIDIGLIGSFGAREVMVATMGVVYGVDGAEDDSAPLAQKLREARKPDGSLAYTPRTGLALLAFFLLACQCMSTVAAIKRETKSWRWPAFVLGYTYFLGYAAAVAIYQIGGILGLG